MRAIVAVALTTAFSRDRRHRWRQVSVLTTAFLATLACCAVLALPTAAEHAYELGSARGPVPAASTALGSDEVPAGAVAAILHRPTIVDGQQVPTLWIEPLPGHEHDPAAVPIGLSSLPAPGAAVLSPGLLSRGHVAEDFGWATSDSGTNPDGSIGRPGVMTASELLIVVRPPEGRTLTDSSVVQYVEGFGVPPSPGGVAYAMDPDLLTPRQTRIGIAAFVLLPAVVLMVSGARARSRLREERMQFLVFLGIAPWRVRALISLETAALAAVGSIGAAGLWLVVSPHVTRIPLAAVEVWPGDLSPPGWRVLAAVVLLVLLTSVTGAIGNVDPIWRRRSRRLLPLAATLGLLVSTALLTLTALRRLPLTDPMAPNMTALAVGVFGILILTPLAMPQVITWSGRVVQRLPSPTLWATGRRMVAEPHHMSRIAGVLSVLIILVSSGMALGLGSLRAETTPHREGPLHQATVSWVDARDGDAELVATLLAGGGEPLLVLPMLDREDETEGEGALPPQLLLRDCAAALRFVGADTELSCDSVTTRDLLEDALQADLVLDGTRGAGTADSVLVYTRGAPDIGALQRELGWLAGLSASAEPSGPVLLPIHRWIGAGLLSVLVLIGSTALREIGDRSVEDAERDAHYARIGLPGAAATRLAWANLLVPMTVGVVLSAGLSAVIAYAGQSIELMMQDPFALLVICGSSIGAAVLAIAVSLPARRAMLG